MYNIVQRVYLCVMRDLFSYCVKHLFSIIILSVCFTCNTYAQNLIPNPSFEIYSSCPNTINQIPLAVPWTNPTIGTSEYFNQCGTSLFGVPSNSIGYQYAKNGVAYGGFYTYNAFFPNSRDYMQTILNDTLIAGRKYCVRFYVSLANEMQYATTTIGAYFSPTAVGSGNYYLLPYTPQVVNSLSNPLTDTLGWILISGKFVAVGGEQYITIGNFNNDGNSDTSFVGGNGWGNNASYYYIDSVTVVECSDTVKPITPVLISSITLPNILPQTMMDQMMYLQLQVKT